MQRLGWYKIVLLGFLGLTTLARAAPSDELIFAFSGLKTFSADFKQSTHSSDGVKIAESAGNFVFERPDRLYWRTKTPDDIRVIGDGKTLWHYDVALAQVVRQPLKGVLDQSPAIILAGDGFALQQRFDIERAPSQDCGQGNDQCFKLSPKRLDGGFVALWVGFSKQQLRQVALKDQLEQLSLILFEKIRMNAPVDSALFTFQIPAGVEVLAP